MAWRLYLVGFAGMIPAFIFSSFMSGQLAYDPTGAVVGIIGASLVFGLVAFLIAFRTYRRAKRDPTLLRRAQLAVIWPGGILFAIILAGQLLFRAEGS